MNLEGIAVLSPNRKILHVSHLKKSSLNLGIFAITLLLLLSSASSILLIFRQFLLEAFEQPDWPTDLLDRPTDRPIVLFVSFSVSTLRTSCLFSPTSLLFNKQLRWGQPTNQRPLHQPPGCPLHQPSARPTYLLSICFPLSLLFYFQSRCLLV